jgi:hypothetical protein
MAHQNSWATWEKTTYLLDDILHSVPDGVMYEDNVMALNGHHGGHQLVAGYQSQLKARTQLDSKVLQEFTVAIAHLAHGPWFA